MIRMANKLRLNFHNVRIMVIFKKCIYFTDENLSSVDWIKFNLICLEMAPCLEMSCHSNTPLSAVGSFKVWQTCGFKQ